MDFLDRFRPQIFALTRIVIGFFFFLHGLQKVTPFGGERELSALIAVAAAVELVGGALVCVGWKTRLAAFVCSGQMAVAYFIAHQADGLLPIQNRGELAAIYAFVFLMIAAVPSWSWAVDDRRK